MNIETKCVQAGYEPKNGESRVIPIVQSTTFKYETSEAMGALFDLEAEGFFYTRLANPTLDAVEKKTLDYLDTLTDDKLYECPENCEHTRMELVLRQFRHISFHTGMLNGQTAVATGKFPMWVSQADKYVDDGIFFGRYRKGQVTK